MLERPQADMKIIKISAIARWFGEPCRWLELDEEAITIVRRDGKRRRFAFAELGWHPRIKRGWLLRPNIFDSTGLSLFDPVFREDAITAGQKRRCR